MLVWVVVMEFSFVLFFGCGIYGNYKRFVVLVECSLGVKN